MGGDTAMLKSIIHNWMLVTLLVLLVACRAEARREHESGSIVVTNGTVIDDTGADPIPDGLVAIEDNHYA